MTYEARRQARDGHYILLEDALADARNRGLIAPYTTLYMRKSVEGRPDTENVDKPLTYRSQATTEYLFSLSLSGKYSSQ